MLLQKTKNMNKQPMFVSYLKTLFDELAEVSKQLIPFDRVFDEDELIATTEQHDMLTNEIHNLKELISNGEHDKDRTLRPALDGFIIQHRLVEARLENLMATRFVDYNKWKKNYLSCAERIAHIQKQIVKAEEIELVLTNTCSSKKKQLDALQKVFIHSNINSLLALASHNKENTYYKSVKSAYDKGLLYEVTYKRLMQ